jgi:5-methyltetrahydrofolate--homocysteine methyltransferase
MKAGLVILKPILADSGTRTSVKIALGTVQGDTHDIGKNIVAAMLEGAGFDVTDLGYDVVPERFVSAIIDDGAQVVGMSALVTTNMLSMKETMDAIVEAGVRDRAKIIIGGAPVTQEYADRIGADAYAEDAAIAVDVVRGFFKEVS